MSDWTAGYVADIGYTYGYYTELNPALVRLAFLNAGLAFPQMGAACELGFGQGLSTNIHAAASMTSWHGTDFNPAQAGFAQELASTSGNGAKLYDEAFAEFCTRSDLPDFDYIGLHGIWSWISDENRAVIVDFIRRKLKVGGVLYISYNTLPGWSTFAPIRHLMTQHAEVMGSQGMGILKRIEGAMGFVDQTLNSQPLYARANPSVAERFGKMKGQNAHYLAHEYFNRDWKPMYFADLAQWLAPAKVNFACSATYLDSIAAVNLTADQQKLLNEIPDLDFRQTVRDFLVNQQFRKDYWVKGPRSLSPFERLDGLRSYRVILASVREDIALKVTGAQGEANLNEGIYSATLDTLADYKPHSLGELEQSLKSKNITGQAIIEAAVVLTGAGHLMPVQDDHVINKSKAATDRLNSHLAQMARTSNDVQHLASPVTGGGVSVGRFQQLFLTAAKAGRKTPEEFAQFAWEILAAQGQKLLKDGAALETPEDNLRELIEQAKAFNQTGLPILRGLKVI